MKAREKVKHSAIQADMQADRQAHKANMQGRHARQAGTQTYRQTGRTIKTITGSVLVVGD